MNQACLLLVLVEQWSGGARIDRKRYRLLRTWRKGCTSEVNWWSGKNERISHSSLDNGERSLKEQQRLGSFRQEAVQVAIRPEQPCPDQN